mgnify:CR=1 FL=1
MRFQERKRRQPPSVIIVSLIDILIVLLIFMMVTTTFRNQPAVKLTLPASRDGQTGTTETETLVITLPKEGPQYFIGTVPLTLEQLQAELNARAAKNREAVVSIRCDIDVPMGRFWDVSQMVQKAGFMKPLAIFTRSGLRP